MFPFTLAHQVANHRIIAATTTAISLSLIFFFGCTIRSVEERSGGQKRSSPDKRHKSAMDAVLHMESKSIHNHHHHHPDSALTANGSVAGEKLGVERFELPRIYISLSRKEKEDDFLAMKGTKLPQRPKKRAKIVDKSLQVRNQSPELDLIRSAAICFDGSQNLHVCLLRFACSLSSRGCGCQI